MTTRIETSLPDIIIAIGTQTSQTVSARSVFEDAAAIVIASPAGLAETVVIQASFDGGTTWHGVEDTDGTDLTLPAAGKCRTYFQLTGLPMIRFQASIAVAAERSFDFFKLWAT